MDLISIFPIFILIYLSLILSSSAHDELKSGQSFDGKVDVQADQDQKKYGKNQGNSKKDPSCNNSGVVVAPRLLAPEQPNRNTKQKHVGECRYDHYEKAIVILLSNAVVDPSAVMIKLIYASVA